MECKVATVSGRLTSIDQIANRAAHVVARIVGMKIATRPFRNRWFASLLDEATLLRFLGSIKSLEEWPQASLQFVTQEEDLFRRVESTLCLEHKVQALRKLSYLYFLSQWGCLSLTEEKRVLYRRARDVYMEAEQLAAAPFYRRVAIPWQAKRFWGNLHLPQGKKGKVPLVLILHGVDDAKEEHLSTELTLLEQGFAVCCIDGPGQAEALLLENLAWPLNFHEAVSAAITTLVEEHDCDPTQVGLMGMSWGGMWAMKTAAQDARIRAVYDLGGPIDARVYTKQSFYVKTKLLQAFNISELDDLPALSAFSITNRSVLDNINCPLRIIHGRHDGLVPVKDKEWLAITLKSLHPQQDISMQIYPTGDHCCTAQAHEVRKDAATFFKNVFQTGEQ